MERVEPDSHQEKGKTLSRAFFLPLAVILNISGKLLKKILEKTGIVENQYGFRKGRSTTDTLKRLMTIINQAEYNITIGIITLDIKNAFNSIN